MPNFDALRSAIIGPMEYVCRPKEKPEELIGLWTLGDQSSTDLSRYGGSATFNFTPVYTSDYGFPLATISLGGVSVTTFTLGAALDMGRDWSLEGYFRDASGRPHSSLDISALAVWAGGHDSENANAKILINNSQIAGSGNWRNPGGLIHRAVQYTASDTTIRTYKNGVIQSSVVKNLSGMSSAIFTYTFKSSTYNNGDLNWGIANVRVVQKALGTSSTFPMPSGLFTGYEVL